MSYKTPENALKSNQIYSAPPAAAAGSSVPGDCYSHFDAVSSVRDDG